MDGRELGRRYVHPVSPDDARDIAGDIYGQTGVTLRQHYAGLALQGCLAYSHVNPMRGNYHENCSPQGLAESCVAYADALLAELAREPQS